MNMGARGLPRLVEVLRNYSQYESAFQILLVDAAMYWTIANLARNNDSAKIEAGFYRNVDEMYVSTNHARSHCGTEELGRIYSEATDCDQFAPAELVEIMRASTRYLKSLDSNNPERILFNALELLMATHTRRGTRALELVDVVCLQELIQLCVAFCVTNNLYNLGGGSLEAVRQAEMVVAYAASKTVESMIGAMETEET